MLSEEKDKRLWSNNKPLSYLDLSLKLNSQLRLLWSSKLLLPNLLKILLSKLYCHNKWHNSRIKRLGSRLLQDSFNSSLRRRISRQWLEFCLNNKYNKWTSLGCKHRSKLNLKCINLSSSSLNKSNLNKQPMTSLRFNNKLLLRCNKVAFQFSNK